MRALSAANMVTKAWMQGVAKDSDQEVPKPAQIHSNMGAQDVQMLAAWCSSLGGGDQEEEDADGGDQREARHRDGCPKRHRR